MALVRKTNTVGGHGGPPFALMETTMRYVIVFLLLTTTVYAQEQQQSTTTTQTSPAANVQRTTSGGASAGGMGGVGSGNTPIPDPTRLTTEAVDRLKEQLKTEIGLQIGQIHKEIDRLAFTVDKMPDGIRLEITNLDKLVNEKFKGLVDQQIQRDNNLALALTAAQKSVTDQNAANLTAANKAEQNFKDQIAATQSTITDLKDRITRIESVSAGAGSAVNWAIVGIGALATMIGIGGAIYGMVKPAPLPLPVPVIQYVEPTNRRR